MKTDFRGVALDCFVDLGITLVYATLVGLVIVAIVASDDGRGSLVETICYAALLPLSVAALILVEIAFCLMEERSAGRKRRTDRTTRRSDVRTPHEILGQVG